MISSLWGMAEERTIGDRYRLVKRVGAGTYGQIFDALAPDGERVAIKVIREHLLVSERERARFEREAAILRGLDHDNIVRLLDSGYTAQGTPFIVFELLTGRSLSAELKRVRFMSASRVAGIARQVLRALAHAHAHGVIHRDIKPSNIHLCRSSTEVDRVKVLDFGVAKPLAEGELERLTDAGAIIGTPGYMAPEQICCEPVGVTADLFALGITMARLLSGERFMGDTLVEVVRTHMGPAPIAVPRAVELSELWPVIERAIQKKPRDRYPSAEAMLAAVDAVMAGTAPTSASGTLLMAEHLETDTSPSSTINIEDMPWLERDVD